MTDGTPAGEEPARPDVPVEDLEVADGSEVDVSGGSTVYVARARGESRPHRLGGTGPTPIARHATGGVLRCLELFARQAGVLARTTVLVRLFSVYSMAPGRTNRTERQTFPEHPLAMAPGSWRMEPP